MPSEINRGIKFGIGFALGVGFILTLFLFSLSMCAGRLHRRMLERMEEMMPGGRHPAPETRDDPVALGSQKQLLFVATGGQAEERLIMDSRDKRLKVRNDGLTLRKGEGEFSAFLPASRFAPEAQVIAADLRTLQIYGQAKDEGVQISAVKMRPLGANDSLDIL